MRSVLATLFWIQAATLASVQSFDEERVIVWFRAFTTPSGGGASTTGAVTVGGSAGFWLATGSAPGGEENLCDLEIGGLASDDEMGTTASRTHHAWRLHVRVVAIENDSIELMVDSTRYGPGLVAQETRERRLRLTAGEPYYADYVESESSERHGCAADNLLLEIRARRPPDRARLALRDDLLRYRAWLTHENAEGETTTSVFEAIGKDGESVRFRFLPFRHRAEAGSRDALEIVTEVSGSVLGRKRADGAIDLTVRADQLTRVGKEGAPHLPSGAGGEKELTVEPGEVVRIEIPHPEGRSMHRLAARPAGRESPGWPDVRSFPEGSALTVRDGFVVVDLGELFRGQQTSLTLSVIPVE